MSKLGSHVVYRVPEGYHTKTIMAHVGQESVEIEGSLHHRELREFAGLVTREREPAEGVRKARPTYDLIIFPPGKAPVHVEGVEEGKGAGEVTILS